MEPQPDTPDTLTSPVDVDDEAEAPLSPEAASTTDAEAAAAAQAASTDDGAEEARVAALEAEAAELRAGIAQGVEEARALREQLTATLERYRTLLLASDPDVPEGLVTGDTAAALDASYGQALALVERLRQRAVDRAAEARTPAGAPARRAPDTEGLSSHQKILLGLQQAG